MISYLLEKTADARVARGFRRAYVKDLDRVAICMLNHIWSPCVWREGYRRQDHFEGALFCVLDFDDGELSLAQAQKSYCDMRGIIGTTRNHQQVKDGVKCDRFRVLLEFEEPILDLRTYRYNMAMILKGTSADKKCKDGARFFYPCKEIVSIMKDGYYHDVIDVVPPEFENFDLPETYQYLPEGFIPTSILRKFKHAYRTGNRNNAIYGFAKDCWKLGVSEQKIFATIKSQISNEEGEPLPEREIFATVKGVMRAAVYHPHHRQNTDQGSVTYGGQHRE